MKTRILKFLDATAGAALCRLLGPLVAARSPQNRPTRTARILLIRPGGIGDMTVLLPILQDIRRALPDAVVDIVCERRNVEVLSLVNMENRALVYDASPLAFLRRITGQTYDVAIDFEQFHHFSAVFALLCRAPVRVGFKVNPHRNPLYTHLVGYDLDGPEATQFRGLLAPLGISGSPMQAGWKLPAPPLPEKTRGAVEAGAGRSGFAVIHASARQRHKRWGRAGFAELAGRLYREHGLSAVLLGSAADRAEIEAITDMLNGSGVPVLPLAGMLTLRDSCAVIAAAALFVGIDSGLAHLATAVDTPTVVLFGATDPRKWGVSTGAHAVVWKRVPCSPCCIFGYHRPCRAIQCMDEITVEDVASACRRVLSSPAVPDPTSV
jgi:ADP-heptose:LPS heptosyltransferase